MRARYGIPLGVTAAGAACVAYAAGFEARSFRLRRIDIPVLPEGMRPIRILQVSDIHMVSGQNKKRRWLQSLAGLRPDLVVNTGDNLSDPTAIPEVLDALGPLMQFPGTYVFGSNDYYGPKFRNPARYLVEKTRGQHGLNGKDRAAHGVVRNPWGDLRDAFDSAGWVGLSNSRGQLKLEHGPVLGLTGLDDPHIKRDRYAAVAGGPDPDTDFNLAIVHAPYLRVLDAFPGPRPNTPPILVPGVSNVFSVPRTVLSRKTGTATFSIRVPGRGLITVLGTYRSRGKTVKVGRVRRTVSRAGTYKLTVKPSRAAKKILRMKGKLRIKVKLTFAPNGGKARNSTRTITLKLQRPARRR